LSRSIVPSPASHLFHAVAFVENFPLKELAVAYPEAHRSIHQLTFPVVLEGEGRGGNAFIYPFGAMVFRDVPAPRRDAELARLRGARPGLNDPAAVEELTVREDPGCQPEVANGVLTLDRLTPERANVVALTVAQSAAMEYYERIVAQLFDRTSALVDRLEKRGTVTLLTRGLHRFIGQAIATRSEVITVLTLLDKPDATWDDPAMDRIYDDLRAEFDLIDRYGALEQKLRFVQDAMELVLDVARDRRMWLLEVAIFGLIIIEVALELWRRS
jgi:uncharacterized Rmd1/YagE family protein